MPPPVQEVHTVPVVVEEACATIGRLLSPVPNLTHARQQPFAHHPAWQRSFHSTQRVPLWGWMKDREGLSGHSLSLGLRFSICDIKMYPGRCGSMGVCHPTKQNVTQVSIPSQGPCLVFRFNARSGCIAEATNQCFSLTSSVCLPLSLPLFPSL